MKTVREYNEQWSAKTKGFSEWLREERESRHVDLRSNHDQKLMREQYERIAQKEPEFT